MQDEVNRADQEAVKPFRTAWDQPTTPALPGPGGRVTADSAEIGRFDDRLMSAVRSRPGHRLAAIAELDPDALAELNSVIDGLIANNRLRSITGGLS